MARPSAVSRPGVIYSSKKARRKVESESESEEPSSDDARGASSGGSSSDEAPVVSTKNRGGGKQNGTAAKQRIARDDSDGDDGSGSDDADSQNVDLPARTSATAVNKARTSKSSSEASTKSSMSGKSGGISNSAPLQPLHQHAHHPAGPRSPFRTVSMNDASPGGKRRLSHSKVARADDLRRQSLPSNLRKQTNAAGEENSSDASFASASADSPARQPKSSGGHASNNTPNKHVLAQAQIRRTSAGYALQGGGIGALNAANALRRNASNTSAGTAHLEAGPAPLPALTKEVMNTNYEEWMKMATDNKINSSNTWSFALIDYFHDMSLLRNADDEGSINFQKASCTLDGCVKIWTSRVDSVATETGKLLNGLAGDAAARAEAADDEDENGDEDGDGVDENGERRVKKKKTKTHTATLADNFSKIQVKDLELEFTVDPLFRKTSADFDEGGAAGLLMNHLGSDSTMRVVFDAGDAKVDDGDEDEEEVDDGLDDDEKLPTLDISKLKATYLPDISVLANMTICPSFSAFKFNSDPTLLDMGLFNRSQADASTSEIQNPERATPGILDDMTMPPAQYGAPRDFFEDQGPGFDGGDDGYADDGGGGFGMPYGDGGDEGGSEDGMAVHAAEAANGAQYGAVQRFDPRMATDQREVVIDIGGEEGDRRVFNYFDTALSKNWAGPEHWKVRRTVRRFEKEKEDEEAAANATGKTTRGRKTKQPFSINFSVSDDNPAPSAKTIFATSTASLSMPGSSSSRRKKGTLLDKKEDYLLPDDMHFSSQQLLSLFLKPKAGINMRRRVQRAAPRPEGEVDEHYWAAAAAAAAQADPNENGDDDDDYGPILPFDTQFFHDDGDTPDFDDDLPMGSDEFEGMAAGSSGGAGQAAGAGKSGTEEEEDLLKATQGQMKRARPEFVSYAKKAKRVDVKMLKENIWKELSIDRLPQRTPAVDDDDGESEITIAPAKQFTSVISGLRQVYPKDKMEEISTSFCFICLLHLANEQGLRIQDGEQAEAVAARGSSRAERAQRTSARASTSEDAEENDEAIARELSRVGGLEKLRIRKEVLA